jgi:hypothetical protein
MHFIPDEAHGKCVAAVRLCAERKPQHTFPKPRTFHVTNRRHQEDGYFSPF